MAASAGALRASPRPQRQQQQQQRGARGGGGRAAAAGAVASSAPAGCACMARTSPAAPRGGRHAYGSCRRRALSGVSRDAHVGVGLEACRVSLYYPAAFVICVRLRVSTLS